MMSTMVQSLPVFGPYEIKHTRPTSAFLAKSSLVGLQRERGRRRVSSGKRGGAQRGNIKEYTRVEHNKTKTHIGIKKTAGRREW